MYSLRDSKWTPTLALPLLESLSLLVCPNSGKNLALWIWFGVPRNLSWVGAVTDRPPWGGLLLSSIEPLGQVRWSLMVPYSFQLNQCYAKLPSPHCGSPLSFLKPQPWQGSWRDHPKSSLSLTSFLHHYSPMSWVGAVGLALQGKGDRRRSQVHKSTELHVGPRCMDQSMSDVQSPGFSHAVVYEPLSYGCSCPGCLPPLCCAALYGFLTIVSTSTSP